MTTPNAFTRSTLVGIAGHMTHALADLEVVLPHMRAVAASATGPRKTVADRALAEAEELAKTLRALDPRAEAAKTLFRNATHGHLPGAPEPELPAHTCPPALLAYELTHHNGPAALPGGGAALVRRQV